MMLRPAFFSTDDPPCSIVNPELWEYIQSLRRRIEVQQDLVTAVVGQLTAAREEVEKLSLDLGIKDQHGSPHRWQD